MDNMYRLNRLIQLWNWLPAFRAVAETEHLGEAGQKIHLSPSALSRAIHQLEDNLGVELFERQGRRLRLNAQGVVFLRAVRRAFRLMDDGVDAIFNDVPAGPLSIDLAQNLGWVIWPWLNTLQRDFSMIEFHLKTIPAEEHLDRLLRGESDVAVTCDVTDEHDEIRTLFVRSIEYGIYCGPQHPLFNAGTQTMDQVRKHAFVALTANSSRSYDGWPREKSREVRMRVNSLESARHMALTSNLLAALPKDYVDTLGGDLPKLRCIHTEDLIEMPLFLLRRASISNSDVVSHVLRRLDMDPIKSPSLQEDTEAS